MVVGLFVHFIIRQLILLFSTVQETEFFSQNGFPTSPFPNGWKGKSGLYAAGFTKKGLSGTSADAIEIAQDLGKVFVEDLKQKQKKVSCHRRCISQL